MEGPQKLKNKTTISPSNSTSVSTRVYPEEMKTVYQRSISTPIFAAALFIAKIWKQSKFHQQMNG